MLSAMRRGTIPWYPYSVSLSSNGGTCSIITNEPWYQFLWEEIGSPNEDERQALAWRKSDCLAQRNHLVHTLRWGSLWQR